MGDTTKLANLIDPEVLAAYVDSKLIENIVFAPLAEVDTTLVGAPGDTIKFPYYSYIGAASDLTEASAISTVSLNASYVSKQVKEFGKGVEISDNAVLSAYGDPIAEIGSQLVKSIADKTDIDMLATMASASSNMTFTAQGSAASIALNVQDISDSLELFGEDIDGPKALIVPPRLYTKIRNVKDWAPASEFAANALVRGAVGRIFGCDIIVSNRLRGNAAGAGLDENAYIVKPGALRLILKRDALAERDRDILRRVTVFTITKHGVSYLYKPAGLIKLKPKTA